MVKVVKKEDKSLGITERINVFINEYLKDRNGSAAYVRAGYSAKSAKQNSHHLLNRPDVKAEVERRIAELNEKLCKEAEVTNERIIKELASIGFFKYRKLFSADNKIKKISDLDDEASAAIAGAKFVDGEMVEIKLHPKVTALIKLGEYTGMFKEDKTREQEKEREEFNKLSPEEQRDKINEKRKKAGLDAIEGGAE